MAESFIAEKQLHTSEKERGRTLKVEHADDHHLI